MVVLVVALAERWTRDRKVTGSTPPGRGAIKSTRSTQPSIPSGSVNRVPACMAGVRLGAFTCVGWQVTLCDPIWQVTSCSSEMGFPWRAMSAFTLFYPIKNFSKRTNDPSKCRCIIIGGISVWSANQLLLTCGAFCRPSRLVRFLTVVIT